MSMWLIPPDEPGGEFHFTQLRKDDAEQLKKTLKEWHEIFESALVQWDEPVLRFFHDDLADFSSYCYQKLCEDRETKANAS